MSDIVDRIDLIRPQPGDVIAIYINRDTIDISGARDIFEALKPVFPNNQIVMMPDETDMICYSKEEFELIIEELRRLVLPDEDLH